MGSVDHVISSRYSEVRKLCAIENTQRNMSMISETGTAITDGVAGAGLASSPRLLRLSSQNIDGHHLARYQLATISSNAQRKLQPSPAAGFPNTEDKRLERSDSSERNRWWPSLPTYDENKLAEAGTVGKHRATKHPVRNVDGNGGLWPSTAGNGAGVFSPSSSSSSSSSSRQDQKDDQGRVLSQTRDMKLCSKPATAVRRAESTVHANRSTPNAQEAVDTDGGGGELRKQLGEHFANLDSSTVRQMKHTDRQRKSSTRKKIVDDEHDARYPCVEGSPRPEVEQSQKNRKQEDSVQAEKSTSSSSLTKVASLLVPSRIYSKSSSGATSSDKSRKSPNVKSLPSSPKLITNTDSNPKISRWASMQASQGAKVSDMVTKSAKGRRNSSKNEWNLDRAAERECKSLEAVSTNTMAYQNGSDTDSPLSGGFQVKTHFGRQSTSPWRPVSVVTNSSPSSTSALSSDGAVVCSSTSPGSVSRRFKNVNGMYGRGGSSFSVAMSGWEHPLSRRHARLDMGVTMEACLFLNRYLQWRYANEMAASALQAKAATALPALYNASTMVSELNAGVARQQMLVEREKQAKKLELILQAMGGPMEEWDVIKGQHSCALSGVMEALEASIMRVPFVHGAKANLQSLRDAVCSSTNVMNAVDHSVMMFLPQMEEMDALVTKLAKTVVLERACLEELHELLPRFLALQTEESSLRACVVQIEKQKNKVALGVNGKHEAPLVQ